MGRIKKKTLAVIVSMTMVLGIFSQLGTLQAALPEYEIYPTPHSINYENSDFILREKANVVYESGIDAYTKTRLHEVANIKNIATSSSEELINTDNPEEKVTNILIGIYNSGEYVDNYVKENGIAISNGLFDKTDSYYLQVKDGNIIVLGKDTDAAFYGLTTLYHIFSQLESRTIRNLVIEDYADVVSRGFIEGYYGSPWSTEDRVELMKWSGYYKLNSYFYAPKDDPKHNAKWRELYTPEEIETKIKPLAKAGNESKCRFVFALHPYMRDATHPDPIRYDSEANYQADLKVMQDKFAQVIDAGVRQIAILADDAPNVGSENYIRTLNDMTNWLKEKQQTYPDLKIILPFCVQEYMHQGEAYFANFPENVQIVMTGGKVFGEASQSFTNNFTNRVGRGPYLWINWPCTDNSRKHLIMGGNDTFLHPNVDPSKVEGIVLNPMQQSEPSKVAIFANGCYTWNIWKSKAEADQVWHDSFKYVDHNSSLETEASIAFRELSKHMMNQDMVGGDNPVTAIEESVDLKPKLNSFKTAMQSNTVTENQVDELLVEFTKLAKASTTYRNQAGDKRVSGQIVYWLDCWDDTAGSAIAYLTAIKASLNNDSTTLLDQYSMGQKLFADSKTHSFQYADHLEYAEVGVQHIVPFIKTLDTYVASQVSDKVNPNKGPNQLEIKNVTKSDNIKIADGGGSLSNVIDGNESTEVFLQAQSNDTTPANAAVTFDLGSINTVSSVSIMQGISTAGDILSEAVVECSTNGTDWTYFGDMESKNRQTVYGQSVKVRYVRIRNKTAIDKWWRLAEVKIISSIDYTIIKTDRWTTNQTNTTEAALNDGNKNTFTWYDPDGAANTTSDKALVGDVLGYDLGKITNLDSAYIVIGNSGADKLTRYCIETSLTGGSDANEWTPVSGYEDYTGNASGIDELTIDLENVEARYIRIRNLAQSAGWIKFSEFTVQESYNVANNVYTNINTSLTAEVSQNGKEVTLSNGEVILESSEYIGLKLNKIQALDQIIMNLSDSTSLQLQVSKNAVEWIDVNAGSQDIDARYIRIMNTGSLSVTFTINEFKVTSHIIESIHLKESNIAIETNWGDTRNNGKAFDGNMSTTNKFGGNPLAGQYIIYDLGQSLNITSLRTYVAAANVDFIRDAKFQISADLQNWQDAFTIGDGVTDTDRTSSAIDSNVFKNIDSSYPNYLYEGNDNLNLTGRYLRILVTADFPDRAIEINEIIINGGGYIPVEDNRELVGALEQRGHHPSLMLDGDLTTSYKSSIPNASMTYYLSDVNHWQTFRVIQSGEVTGASVKATFMNTTTRSASTETVEVGKLNQAINEFIIPAGKKLLSVEISWQDKIPEISEVILSKNTSVAIDKTALQQALTKDSNDHWTLESKEAFLQAKTMAQEIFDSQYYSQQVIDSATVLLNNTYDQAKVKADKTALEQLVQNAITNENEYYTALTYGTYENRLNELKDALQDSDNLSQDKADLLVQNLENAKNALVYSAYFREVGKLALLDDTTLASQNYSTVTYNAYQTAKTSLQTLITDDENATGQEQRVAPNELLEKTNQFNEAINNLADVTELKAEIADISNYDSSMYTAASYNAYKEAVDKANDLLINGTKETIASQIALIQQRKSELVSDSSIPLDEVIADAESVNREEYTTVSYNNLMTAVANAKINPNPTVDEKAQYVKDITDAKTALVSIVALKQRIADAKQLDTTIYTKASYQVVEQAIIKAEGLMVAGSKTDISNMIDSLNKAIAALERSGVQEWKDYTKSITLKDAKYYTNESYQAYKAAYDHLLSLSGDISLREFKEAKENFEKQESLLQGKLADYTQVNQIISQIPKDLSIYNSQAVQELKQVLASIDYNKSIFEQDKVDQYAKDLRNALDKVLKSKNNNNGVNTNDTTPILFTGALFMMAVCGIYVTQKRKERI